MARYITKDDYEEALALISDYTREALPPTWPTLPKELTAKQVETVIDCYVRSRYNKRVLIAEALANERREDG